MGKFRSSALSANLQETQGPIQIPPEQLSLLEITKNLYGVSKRVQEFLTELNHPYANWDLVVEGLRYTALSYLHYFLEHEDRRIAVNVLTEIFKRSYTADLPQINELELLRTTLEFLTKLLETEPSDLFEENILDTLEHLRTVFQDNPTLCQGRSTLFNRAHETFLTQDKLVPVYRELFQRSLLMTYQCWLDHCDLGQWYRVNRNLFSAGSDYESLLDIFAPQIWGQLMDKAQTAETIADLVLLPDYKTLVDQALETIQKIQEPADRAQFLLYMVDNETFGSYEHWLMSDLVSCLRALEHSDETVILNFIPRFFALLERHQFKRKSVALNCAYTLGETLAGREEEILLDEFITRLIDTPFEEPEIYGVTDQWEVLINPNHLPFVRLLVHLVQIDPSRFRRLLSALLLQIAIQGLFIKDTDLFQKDVSQLLNARIGPVYQKVKQLARMFPIYFTDIGSEGELRDVSTEIDQIQARKDPLIHFLRKLTHVESNNTQVDFTKKIIRFWTTGDKTPLASWLPEEVYEPLAPGGTYFDSVHQVFKYLDQSLTYPDYLEFDYDLIAAKIDEMGDLPEVERKRAKLLVRLYKLLEEKYSFATEDIAAWIERSVLVKDQQAAVFLKSLSDGYPLEILQATLDVLETLQMVILDPEPSSSDERIYYKRHIGAGIPSMYGAYRERKFEALGMTFRLEKLARSLFADLVSSLNLTYVTKKTLLDIHQILTLLARALHIDGMTSASLENNINLLEMGLQAQGFSVDQFVNVFQYIAGDVNEITNRYVLNVHTGNLELILERLPQDDSVNGGMNGHSYSLSERILRGLITSCFGLQDLDDLVGKVLVAMTNMRQHLDDQMQTLLMSYDPYRLLSTIHGDKNPYDDPLHLGSKGYFLKRLSLFELPVPEGFIVTTELFRCQGAMNYIPFQEDARNRIREYLLALEKASGKRFGKVRNPLLLSVRSSSVMSMPGMMSTFLNVGLNDEITETLGENEKYSWGAWDCYRRLIQSWAMSHGVDRDLFDKAIQNAKERYGVEKKMEFQPEHMREITYQYKEIMADHGINLIQQPFEQLIRAVQIVLESWFAQRAEDYRQHLGIADQWGTSVIVQRMVFGNLNQLSGSGVVMTRSPLDSEGGFDLYGDYNICSQGEDVVSGLVNPLPITVSQQQVEGSNFGEDSLQRQFPDIYQKLRRAASFLIEEKGYAHQEIEFTFESEQIQDLYILQTRNMVFAENERVKVFVTSDELKDSLLGRGIGAGGGALAGRVAFTSAEIKELRDREPGCVVILVRPDTVPEDFSLIAEADGLLTARGGCTSHAAVAAQRLGKTCVVNCRSLKVEEDQKRAELNGINFHYNDHLSIDGRQGTIYQGKFPVQFEDIVF